MDFSRFLYKPPGLIESKASSGRSEIDIVNLVDEEEVKICRNPSPPACNVPTSLNCEEEGVGLGELYKSPSQSRERPLRLLIIGHNPSSTSWEKGHYYANPANRMWALLSKASIVPSHFKAVNDRECPALVGVGFTDILTGVCETQSNKISDDMVNKAKRSLYQRLLAHCHRVHVECGLPIHECYPRIIAFAGVRQYKALFANDEKAKRKRKRESDSKDIHSDKYGIRNFFGRRSISSSSFNEAKDNCEINIADGDFDGAPTYEKSLTSSNFDDTIDLVHSNLEDVMDNPRSNPAPSTNSGEDGKISFGTQSLRPTDWPEELAKSLIFLLPSSSGAAAMTTAAREGPYLSLGKLMKDLQYESHNIDTQVPTWRRSLSSVENDVEIL